MTSRDTSVGLTVVERTPDPRSTAWELGFGVALVLFALVALLVWFPLDITGSFIERNPIGKIGPGDAFFPVLLACAILVLSLIHLIGTGAKVMRGIPSSGGIGGLNLGNLLFLCRFHGSVLLGLAAMYLLGPAFVAVQNAVTGGSAQYRHLVDTVPYKYIGFVVGALIMTLPTIAWAEGRSWSARSVITVLAVVLAIIIVFDVLLANVQLPPNADV